MRDSILERGLADPYLILVDEQVAAYAGIWNKHFKGRVMEFHTPPQHRAEALEMFRALLAASGATHIEAQTNIPLLAEMLSACGRDITEENILFADGPLTKLSCPGAEFRRREPAEEGPDGDWVVQMDGAVVAAGGILHHYNPPYGDIYVEVITEARRQGIGSYLVQELRRACHQQSKRPAARCAADNEASIRTLQRGGLVECGRILAGPVMRADR